MPIGLDHMILPVNDADKSVAFYTDVLGFTRDPDREPFSVVRVTPTFTLQLAPWGTEGHWHLAFAFDRGEFDEVLGRVQAAGLAYGDTFHEPDNGRGPAPEDGSRGPGHAVYLLDPNRHLIELRYYDEGEVEARA